VTFLRKRQFWIYLALIVGSLLVVYPFVFMILNSFKVGTEILNYPTRLPQHWSLDGYHKVFEQLDLGNMFKNTIIIAVSVTALNVVLSSMVAYALSKLKFPGKGLLFQVIIGSMMIPTVLLMIPAYSMYYEWGWINTYTVMIVPAAVSAYNIFLIRQFMIAIPNDFLEASRLDGCTEIQTYRKIVLPMSLPVLSTVAILTFMNSWNDLAGPLLYLQDRSMYTLQLGLYTIKSEIPGQNLEQLWAALTVTTLPIVFVFFFLQRYFVNAFTGVGLK